MRKKWNIVSIDSVEKVADSDITLNNLRIMFRTAKHQLHGRGANRTRTYRLGFGTELGNIEKSCWKQLAEIAVERELKPGIVDQMREFLREQGVPRRFSMEDFEIHVLEMCVTQNYEDPTWKLYEAYNEYISR